MKFINKVVIFVMGVVVIGVVATAIGVATRVKNVEKSVTFELLENDELSYNVYDIITEYAIFENDKIDNYVDATNVVNITVNNNDGEFIDPLVMYLNNGNYLIVDGYDDFPEIYILPNNTYGIGVGVSVGDIITIIFEVEQETPAIIKTLLFLIPLVFSASLIGYLAFRKGEKL